MNLSDTEVTRWRLSPKAVGSKKWVLALVVGGLVLYLSFVAGTSDSFTKYLRILIIAICLGVVGYALFLFLRVFYYRWQLARDNAQTTATILSKSVKIIDPGEDQQEYYYIAFEFNPIEATHAAGGLRLKARVGEDYWKELNAGQSITVLYSKNNPRIVRLAGE